MRTCPKCRSSDYNNRHLNLMINVCGHSLCKNCVDTIFALNSGPCPTCGRTLKKNAFWLQTLDDPQIEREVHFRKEYRKIFNLHEDNFPDLRAYNDYLEMVEDVVFKLSHDVDVPDTLAAIAAFEAKWEAEIGENRGRKTADELWVLKGVEEERRYRQRLGGYKDELVEEAASVAKTSETSTKAAASLIAQLQASAEPAEFIVNNAQRAVREAKRAAEEAEVPGQRRPKEPRREEVEEDTRLDGFSVGGVGVQYVYSPPTIPLNGPAVPDVSHLRELGYMQHIRPATKAQLAGGYDASIGCFRALLEASSDLFLL